MFILRLWVVESRNVGLLKLWLCVLYTSQYALYCIQYWFCTCTDYRVLEMIVRDPGAWVVGSLIPPLRGKSVRRKGTGNACQQLFVELVLTTELWVLLLWDSVRRVCLGGMGSTSHMQDKGIFVSRMADLVRGALNCEWWGRKTLTKQPCEGVTDRADKQRACSDVTERDHKISKTELKQGHL